MQRLQGPYRVYVGLVSTGYLNADLINQTIRDGMAFCGVTRTLERAAPGGKIVIKTDVLLADEKIARHTYTHPEVVRGAIAQLLSVSRQSNITVTAEAQEGVAGYRMLQKAHASAETFRLRGYYELEQMYPGRVSVLPDDEAQQCRYQLSMGNVLSNITAALALESTAKLRATNEVLAPQFYAESDFTVYLPKLKGNVLSQGFSGAVKLGSPRDTFGFTNDHHIGDMLEVCNPDLVISDAIIAAVGGNAMTQRGHELGVILISNNAVAHDWIAAQILNLDPLKIAHLKVAMERGWGPASSTQIELGGAGLDGVKQLAQKSKFWDVGTIAAQEFAHKYDRENPGLKFPIEILSGPQYETAGAHGLILDWMYLTYDFPQLRPLMARWPKITICAGTLTTFPTNHVVCAIGTRAVQSLAQTASHSSLILRWRGLELRYLQLKNGTKHLAVFAPATRKAVALAMLLASFGRAGSHFVRLGLVFDRFVSIWRTRWRAAKNSKRTPVVMTCRMPKNSWWSLKQTSRSTVPTAAKAVSAPL